MKLDFERSGYNEASALPVPHPLDYEWRFAAGAVDLLWENVLKLSQSGDTVAFLGTTSVFHRAHGGGPSRHNLVLLDASQPTVVSFSHPASFGSAFCCDISCGRLPALTAQVVVIDPPWYPAYISSFLWAASQICAMDGHVLMSTPPVGTRPGIEAEWEETMELTKKMGLHMENVQPSALPYISPPFERNALRAAGISNYPTEWRRGHLSTFAGSVKQVFKAPRLRRKRVLNGSRKL